MKKLGFVCFVVVCLFISFVFPKAHSASDFTTSAVSGKLAQSKLKKLSARQQIKIRSIVSILKSIDWPDADDIKQYQVGLVGVERSFVKAFRLTVRQMKKDGKPIKVKLFNAPKLAELRSLNLVYFSNQSTQSLLEFDKQLKAMPLLVVTDSIGTYKNYVVNISMENDKLSINANGPTLFAKGFSFNKSIFSIKGKEEQAASLLRNAVNQALNYKKEVENKENELASLLDKNNEQLRLLEEKNASLKVIEGQLAEQQRQVSLAANNLRNKQMQIGQYETLLEERQRKLNNMQQVLEQRSFDLSRAEQQLEVQLQLVTTKEFEISTLTQDAKTAEERIGSLRDIEKGLELQLDSKRKDIKSLGNTISRQSYGLVLLVLFIAVIIIYVLRKKVHITNQVNSQLKQVDKLKDEFLANTSHELRTPLNGIIGIAESLIDGAAGSLPLEAKHNLTMVAISGKRLAHLVNDILDFSKLKHRNLMIDIKAIDLESLAQVVITLSNPLINNKPLTLINEIPEGLPAVLADEDRLQQILFNLIGNAIKFTDKGEIRIHAQVAGSSVKIRVTDTGVGIEEDKLKRIFNTFEQGQSDETREFSGTGLGLAVTKQLVELHSGNISVSSTLGVGTQFSFTLPYSKHEVDKVTVEPVSRIQRYHFAPLPEVEATTDGGHFKILIVDDEAINRQVLHNHLSLQQYHLFSAASGQEALLTIEQNGPFDLVLLDIMMPQMSGFEVCKRIREQFTQSELIVLFLTAKNQVNDLVQSFAVGANDYLTKPVNKHELLTRVETHLHLLDTNRDLERKVNERTNELVHAEKMTSLGTLTAGVAHEINNPTNFAHVSCQNLQFDLRAFESFLIELAGDGDKNILELFKEKFEPLYRHLDTIKTGTERIKGIVQDLRTFTQLDAADYKSVDITECLQATINLVSNKKQGIAVVETNYKSKPKLWCYPSQLNQVFMKVLVNAFEAIDSRIEQNDKDGKIVVSCDIVGKNIEISIEDNGCGMSELTKAKLFEPFYTTKKVGEGTGLGLSIAYGIVKQHSGDMSAHSSEAKGSVLRIRLPQKSA